MLSHNPFEQMPADCVPLAAPLGSTNVYDVGSALPPLHQTTIMIVDDGPTNIRVVRRLLEIEGFQHFVTTTESKLAVKLIRQHQPDLVLLDVLMPGVNGLEILAEVRQDPAISYIPIVILTSATDRDTRLLALERGATDFVTKPIDPSELLPRVRNVLAVKHYQNCLKNYATDLEAAVRNRTSELEASRRDLVQCLARAAEFRDDDTGHHVVRVGRYARLVGEALGLSVDEATSLEQAAQLHDVGKIGVPDSILLKAGKLTDEEFAEMRRHSGFGKRILDQCSHEERQSLSRHAEVGGRILAVGNSPVLEMATRIALTHHEWWDGSGYPLGLAGEDIPLEGRITAIADVFDALCSRRCYKAAFPLEKCFAILREESGTHFDPQVVDAFFRRRDEIVAVQMQHAEEA